jgi:SAM-dependent methyltransferase
VGARVLVERLVERGGLSAESSVLCIGSRNGIELDLFRSHGVGDVVGIDLFSQRRDILVMDMHALRFPDDRFDAVYASHALEHAYDLDTVLGEIGRVTRQGGAVAVEVPVRYKGSDADLIVFESLGELREALAPHVATVLWDEEQPAGSRTNAQASAVARIIFEPRHRRRP